MINTEDLIIGGTLFISGFMLGCVITAMVYFP